MEEELSLREAFDVIIKGKIIIIATTIAFMLVALVYNYFILTPVFEAKTILSVNQEIQLNNKAVGLEGLINNLAEPPRVNTESFAAQAMTSAVLRETMERVRIDPQKVPISSFSQKIRISNLPGTDLLEITAKDSDPRLAADIANTLAEVFVDFVSDTSKSRIGKTITFLESQVREEQQKLNDSVEKMKIFLTESPSVAQLEKQLQTSLNLLSLYQERAADYEVTIRGIEASIEAAEKELSVLPDKIQLKKNLFDDPSLYQTLIENKEAVSDHVNGLVLLTEELSPAYAELSKELGLNKSRLAMYIKQEEAVKEQIHNLTTQIEKIQIELSDKKTRYEQLEAELNRSIQNYELFNNKYTETKITQSVEAGEAAIVVVSHAYEPVMPIRPRKKFNIAIGSILGFMFSIFIVFIRSYLANSKPDGFQKGV